MAKKPSLDLNKVKEFLFQKGERVGLGAAMAIAVLVLALGLIGGSTSPPDNSGPNWPVALTKVTKNLENEIQNSTPPEGHVLNPIPGIEAPRPPQNAALTPFFNPALLEDTKKRTPPILSVSNREGDIQIDYLPAPALSYDINDDGVHYTSVIFNNKDTKQMPAKLLEPKRLVVVSANFPLGEQLKLFRLALRYPTLKELVNSADAPHFLGINVGRTEVEVEPDGTTKETAWLPLYVYEAKKGKTKVADHLDKFFRRMVIDTHNPGQFGDFLAPNMATPLPYLATIGGKPGRYPRARLTGIEQEPDEAEADPVKSKNKGQKIATPGGKPATQPIEKVVEGSFNSKNKWADLPVKDLHQRILGNYNVFSPQGKSLPKPKGKDKGKKGVADTRDPVDPNAKLKVPFPKGVKPPDSEDAPEVNEEEALGNAKLMVRFIDVDVEVGKTYRYWIQVRVANPLYGKPEHAATDAMTKEKDLYSDPTQLTPTPAVTVQPEYFYYIFDQPMSDIVSKVKSGKEAAGNDARPLLDKADAEKTALQIHRWVIRTDDDRVIGDWAVAERLLVKRGEVIGRKVMIEVPEWNPRIGAEGDFELRGFSSQKVRTASGIPVNFKLPDPAPVLLDFSGGVHSQHKVPGSNAYKDQAPTDALVLTPEGKLVVRSSREDAEPATDTGRVRAQHYQRWRNRVILIRSQESHGSSSPGINFPKGK